MNAETLVETYNKNGELQPAGTKLKLSPDLLESFLHRGIVKELKVGAKTKELKVELETKQE